MEEGAKKEKGRRTRKTRSKKNEEDEKLPGPTVIKVFHGSVFCITGFIIAY